MKALGTWRLGRVSFEMLETFSLSEFPKIAVFFLFLYFFVLEYTGTQSWHGFLVGDILGEIDASRLYIYTHTHINRTAPAFLIFFFRALISMSNLLGSRSATTTAATAAALG